MPSHLRVSHVGATAAAAAVLGLLGCGTSPDDDAPTTDASAGSASSVAPDRGPGVRPEDPPAVTGRVVLGGKPCGIVGGEDRVWVTTFSSGSLYWIDPETLEKSEPIEVGTKPCGLALGAGSVWVENYASDDVTRVDAATGEVISTIEVGAAPYDVTFADGAAWVTDYEDGTVSRIDAETEERTVIEVSDNPIGIVQAGGSVWVAHALGDLLAIDPGTSEVTTRTSVGEEASWTAADGDDLWVAGRMTNVVRRVDAATGDVVETYDVGELPLDGDVVDGVAWFPDKTGNLHELPADASSTGRVLDSGLGWPFVIAGHDGDIWAADYTGSDVTRVDPDLE